MSIPSRPILACLFLGLAPFSRSGAQLPGLPVLQNGFASPGISVGVNYGTADDARGYAAAAAWAPSSARLQVSVGIGGFDPDDEVGDEGTALAYGGRVAVPLVGLTGGRAFGIVPFAGIGGASRDDGDIAHVPAGVSVGYRFAVAQTRAISVYVAPFYGWHRISLDDVSESNGLFRVSIGADATLTGALGLTIGYEFGAEADVGEPGPTSPQLGIGLSYAFRR